MGAHSWDDKMAGVTRPKKQKVQLFEVQIHFRFLVLRPGKAQEAQLVPKGFFRALLLGHCRMAQLVLGAVFEAFQGGTTCFGSCFLDTLGRHSVLWKLLFGHFRAAQPVLGAAFGAL